MDHTVLPANTPCLPFVERGYDQSNGYQFSYHVQCVHAQSPLLLKLLLSLM